MKYSLLQKFFAKMTYLRLVLAVVGVICLVAGIAACRHFQGDTRLEKKRAAMESVCEEMRASLPAIKDAKPGEYGEAAAEYLSYFGFPKAEVQHTLGYLPSEERRLFIHFLRPEGEIKGGVVLSHGYVENSGLHSRFVSELLNNGYRVCLWDLPGHGLSEGKRAFISDFAEYGDSLAQVMRAAKRRFGTPVSLIGHSTGCSAILQYVHDYGTDGIADVILVAPLVRSYAWHVSQISNDIAGPFTDRITRVQKTVTHDEQFQRFLNKGNPLRISSIPLAWVDALKAWHDEVLTWKKSNFPLTIVQGTNDTVLSWKYNLGVLRGKFPNASVHKIQGGFHHLLNEKAEMRDKVYQIIFSELEAGEAEEGSSAEEQN